MLGYLLVILTGYYAIASIRSSIEWIKLGDDDAIDKWANEHPYHYFLKEAKIWRNNPTGTGWIGGSISAISWMAAAAMLLANFSFYVTPLFLGVSVYGLVTFSYWLHTKNYFANWQITRLWQRAKNWWQSRIPAEIQEAKAILESISSVIKGKAKSKSIKGIMAKADKLIREELPRLLNLRQELTFLIDNAMQIIQKEKDNGIVEGEEQLMKESEKGLATLNKRLSDVNKKIRLIPTVLDHLCIQLSVIISADSVSDVQNVIDDVKMDLDILLQSHEEIEALDAKYQAAKEAARKELHGSTTQAIEEIFPKRKEPAKVAEA